MRDQWVTHFGRDFTDFNTKVLKSDVLDFWISIEILKEIQGRHVGIGIEAIASISSLLISIGNQDYRNLKI